MCASVKCAPRPREKYTAHNERPAHSHRLETIMTKLEAFKLATRIVVGAGTTTISNSIIRNNVAPTNLFQTVSVGVASVVIGSMAAEAAKSHTDTKIDELAELWTKNPSDTTVTA